MSLSFLYGFYLNDSNNPIWEFPEKTSPVSGKRRDDLCLHVQLCNEVPQSQISCYLLFCFNVQDLTWLGTIGRSGTKLCSNLPVLSVGEGPNLLKNSYK